MPPVPKNKVLSIYVGKEFGDLLSSLSPRNRLGRILYCSKCDLFMMLSYVLGTAEPRFQRQVETLLPIKPVADYLNDKVHSLATQLIQEHYRAPAAGRAPAADLETFVRYVDLDLWEVVS